MNYIVEKYCAKHQQEWNTFVSKSINATFLFQRDFIEYHKDRFLDYSLIVLFQKDIVAVIPSNIKNNELYSHQGLTYGGLVLKDNLSTGEIEQILEAITVFLKGNNIKKFILKQIPTFYAPQLVHIIDETLLNFGAKKIYTMMNLAVDYSKDLHLSKSKLKHYRRIKAIAHLQIVEESSLDLFWNEVLTPRLLLKFGSHPVHSLTEIAFLKSKFPENIRQFSVYLENKIIAGLTLFESQNVVKSQYGATTSLGEKHRALDFLFIHLIEKYKNEEKHFFDMGTVYNGKSVNEGLLNQKVELGCSIFEQNYFEINL